MPVASDGRSDVADGLSVESVERDGEAAEEQDAELERADRARIEKPGNVNYLTGKIAGGCVRDKASARSGKTLSDCRGWVNSRGPWGMCTVAMHWDDCRT
jgi:hypothetical protein